MQINRLFEIIYILLNKKTVTAKMLAERFEVSTRTIYRDIETLSASGIPVYMSRGSGGGISILPNFVLNKSILTDEEKSYILSAVKAVSAIDFSDTKSALNKLVSMLGENSSDWIEVDFSQWSNNAEADIFSALKSAILLHNIVSFSYSNNKGENSFRTVQPHKLCFKGGAWYLYGYCNLRKNFRFFKFRRIKNLSVSDDKFTPTQIGTLFSKYNYYKTDFVKLKLKISDKSAFRVYDEFDNYELQPDGSFIVEIDFPNDNWLKHYIMSYGSDCEVLEPKPVRDCIINELKKALDNYK